MLCVELGRFLHAHFCCFFSFFYSLVLSKWVHFQEKVKLAEVLGRMDELSKTLAKSNDVEREIEECKSVDMDLHLEVC